MGKGEQPYGTGRCLCDRVTFSVSSPPLMTLACHCKGCQRLTSSAYSVSGVFPREAFELTTGEAVIGALRGEAQHWYCDSCKSWIYTVPPGNSPVVNVRLTLLDDPPRGMPHVEMYTSEAQEWALLGSPHQFAKFPPPEDYPALAESFAGRTS